MERERLRTLMGELRWALDFFEGKARQQNCRTLHEAITELLQAKERSNRRPAYLKSVRQYLAQFEKGRETLDLSAVTHHHIEDWFASRSEPPATMRSNLGRISALFSFGMRRGWIDKNPCDRIERPTVERGEPSILTPAECNLILTTVRERWPQHLAAVTLGLFCGVRPGELRKIRWEHVDLENRVLIINASTSKVRQRRTCPIESRPWRILSNCRGSILPVASIGWRRLTRRLRVIINRSSWPQDVLRHTAASFMLARYQDASKVATWLGNSPNILLRHYVSPVGNNHQLEFWENAA